MAAVQIILKPLCTRFQKGDSHLKYNNLISTIPYLPFLPSNSAFCPSRGYSGRHLCVVALHSPFLYSDPSPFRHLISISQAMFEPTPYPYKYPKNPISLILPTYNACEVGTECSETSVYKIQTPGYLPKVGI